MDNILFILTLSRYFAFVTDNFLVQDDIQKIFERVRQKADFMPEWQMNEVMTNDFGTNWRENFEEFQDRPFAAAR